MSDLTYDVETLNARDYSYKNQLADMVREGWEIDPAMEAGNTVYLRRHQRVGDLLHEVNLKRRSLRFEREADGTWIAKVVPPIAAAATEVFSGGSSLEAAEAAWRWLQTHS